MGIVKIEVKTGDPQAGIFPPQNFDNPRQDGSHGQVGGRGLFRIQHPVGIEGDQLQGEVGGFALVMDGPNQAQQGGNGFRFEGGQS